MSLELLNNPFLGNFKEWESNNSFEKMSAFKNSPFGQYWEKNIPKYAEAFYSTGLALGNSTFRIFDLSKKISQTQAVLYQNQISENWDDTKFIVYANPDGDQVLKDYANQNYVPKENEVLFFIETNDGKFDFGKIVRIKLGENAIKKLHFRFPFIGETDEEELAEAFLKRPFEVKLGKEYQFFNNAKIEVENAQKDTEELKNILAKAINYDYNQKQFDDMSWFLVFLQGEEWIGLNTPKKLMEISQWMRTKKYEEEKYWNAQLKEGFTPAFLPQFLVEDNNQKREEAIRDLVKSKIDEIIKSEQDDGITAKIYKQILRSILLYLFDCYYQSIKIVGIVLTETDVLYNLNAFLVGLWNGCLEFVAGMIDLVALSMVIARDGIGYTMADALSEKFENLLNEIVYNFEAFIKKLWDKFIYAINEFPDWVLKYGINPYYLYKKLGELTPDILTFLIPALKAGKAAKIAEAAKMGSTVVKETTEISEELMQKSAKELSEKLEKETAEKEVKESFEKAKQELEEKIPETKEIEEVKVKGKSRKKVRISNTADIGKPDNKVIFKLVDDAGKEIGELIRGVGTKGRSTTYKLKFSSGKRSLDLNSEVKLYDSRMARSENLPVEGTEQIIYGDLNIPIEITSEYSGLGELMLDESLAYFKKNPKQGKVDGNIGYWVRYEEYYKDYGGQSVNLKKFWEAVDAGKSYEDAAFETFTGKWAKKNGFTKVVYKPNNIKENRVIVKFLR